MTTYVEDEVLNQQIIEGMKQEGGVDGDFNESLEIMEDHLFDTEWREEAKQIPLNPLDPDERSLILRYSNGEDMNDEEKHKITSILEKYRESIQKFKPAESIENYEKNVLAIEDEKKFLELVKKSQENKIIPFYYPISENTELKIELVIKPLTDSTVVEGLTENLQDFQDFTDKEREIIIKQQSEQLNREEQAIFNNIQRNIKKRSNYGSLYNEAIEFLSKQTSFKGKDSSYETMKEIYTTIDITYVFLLFNEVQKELRLKDVNTDKLFRKTD